MQFSVMTHDPWSSNLNPGLLYYKSKVWTFQLSRDCGLMSFADYGASFVVWCLLLVSCQENFVWNTVGLLWIDIHKLLLE